ncbi:DNA helicase [Tanacetum coccineum]
MRLSRPDVSADERDLIISFASWLLDIGDGKTCEPYQQDPENTSWIDISHTYCLPDNELGLSKLVDFIYDENTLKTPSVVTWQQKAIVCPKNETADTINSKVLQIVQGETMAYFSHDEATPLERDGAEIEMLYPIEHLNTLKFPSFPPHQLELKVGAPVILLRNVNVDGGLCNGTRMIVRQMMTKLIEVQIITGSRVGEKLESKIPRPNESSEMQYLVLTDYIGCIRGVSDLIPFGDPNKTQSTRRKIEIKNLNGNIIKLTLWNEMAEHFGQADFEKMDQPVIITVSSCRVSKYRGSSPDTKKLLHSLSANFRIKTLKNKSFMEQNPLSNKCNKAAIAQGEKYSCLDHGPQPGPFFRYKFKGHIRDSSRTVPMTFFSPAADKITKHLCQELVEKYNPADPQKIPPEVLATQGKTSIFQFHFNTIENTIDLTLDEVFDVKTTDEGASSITEQTYKGTSSVTPTAVVQSVENQEQEAKGKEKIVKEQTNKATPPTSLTTAEEPIKISETGGTTKENPIKRPLFSQSSTDSKKQKDNSKLHKRKSYT